MVDMINYVAISDGHALFGVAEDPAAQVATMQASSAAPIELAAGWVVPPQRRSRLHERIHAALRPLSRRGDWIKVPRDYALFTLSMNAMELGGKEWHARKRPTKPPNDPRARAVVTPGGRYPSAQAAAAAHGISRQAAWERAMRGWSGWRFADAG